MYFLMFLMIPQSTSAQWTTASGVPNTIVWDFVADGSTFFAAANNGRIYQSTNDGVTWIEVVNLTDGVYCLEKKDSCIFAGTMGDLFRSTNHGMTWEDLNINSDPTFVRSLALYGGALYAGSSYF
jgi:photosystem II stability/assembly factor-like uncharacterized protein